MDGITREDSKKCVGPGWSALLDQLYDRLSEPVYVSTIKEKFGALRVYVYNASETDDQFITQAENRSLEICELCGLPGKLRDIGWIKTMCYQHYLEHNNARAANNPLLENSQAPP